MRIVHFSDWHGRRFALPGADLYVCTGDMLPNFRIFDIEVAGGRTVAWEHNLDLLGGPERTQPKGAYVKRPPDPDREEELQRRYLARMGHGYLRALLGNPTAPVVHCRGNHDFTSLHPMFADGGVGTSLEIDDASNSYLLKDGAGLIRIGGMRGMRRHRGRWSDEMSDDAFADHARRLPRDLDVLVTHSPPEGILDELPGEHPGSPALRSYVARHDPSLPPLKAHLFGHIHEARGTLKLGGTLFSNAATGWHEIEI